MKPIDFVAGSILFLAVVIAVLSAAGLASAKRDKVEMKGELFIVEIEGRKVACSRIVHPSAEGYLCVLP